MSINIIGVSALYHDSACCLLTDGKVIAAAQEERFTRRKHDPSMPRNAFQFCLKEGGLTLADIDCIAFYENPNKKFSRQLWSGIKADIASIHPSRVEQEIREILGYEKEIEYFDHHLSHAASSFFFSGFNSSAIMTTDGVGEWATTTYGTGKGTCIDLFEEVDFPNSIGLLYSTITKYLGFKVNGGEYKVMGLAPYGKPKYKKELYQLISIEKDGQYKLNMKYFDYVKGTNMFSSELPTLLGGSPRTPESPMTQFYMDISASLQAVLEEILIEKTQYLFKKTNEEYLCLAGGVALNCVANGKIVKDRKFKKVFVQPASNDAGGALGAAALAHTKLTGESCCQNPIEHVFLGPKFGSQEISQLLESSSLKYYDFRQKRDLLYQETAKLIAQENVIGWFNGRMEFGPRALGCRSILADPRCANMREKINSMVKKREGFRPFAPMVLEEFAKDHFDLDHPSPFMLETCQVRSELFLPAITHVDNSARVQTVNRKTNPEVAKLLDAFNEISGCPILLNTSFNVRGEPIVCSPEDAIACFVNTEIDCLVLGDFIIQRKDNSLDTIKAILDNTKNFLNKMQPESSAIIHDLYTFV